MMRTSMGKSIPDLTLRLWTPAGATRRVRQAGRPDRRGPDRTAGSRRARRSASTRLGSWGAEDRDYHVQVDVEPAAAGKEKLAARVSVVAGDEVLGQGLVNALWTADTALSAQDQPPGGALHRSGRAGGRRPGGVGARAGTGDVATATAKLQRAMELAVESGNDGKVAELCKGHRRRRADGNGAAQARGRGGRRDGPRRAVDEDRPGTEGEARLMPICAEGHASAADDYCDVCGAPIGSSAAPVDARPPAAADEGLPRVWGVGQRPLLRDVRPRLGAARAGVASAAASAPASVLDRRRRRRPRVLRPRGRPAADPTPSTSRSSSRNVESSCSGDTALIGQAQPRPGRAARDRPRPPARRPWRVHPARGAADPRHRSRPSPTWGPPTAPASTAATTCWQTARRPRSPTATASTSARGPPSRSQTAG